MRKKMKMRAAAKVKKFSGGGSTSEGRGATDSYDVGRVAYRLGISPEEARQLQPTRQEMLRRAHRNNTPISQSELARYPETEREALQQLRGSRRNFPGEQPAPAGRQQGPRMSDAGQQPSLRSPRMSDASGQPALPRVAAEPTRSAETPRQAPRVPSEEDARIAYALNIPANELTAADRARYAERQARPGFFARLGGSAARTAPAPTAAAIPAGAVALAPGATPAPATTPSQRGRTDAEREAERAQMMEINEPAGRGRPRAPSNRGAGRTRESLTADDLNAMVLDRLGSSYSGRAIPANAEAVRARGNIEKAMGYKKGGRVAVKKKKK